jgi:hypothetical protein
MILLLPVDLAYGSPALAAVSPVHVVTALATIVVTGVAVMGQLYRVEQRRALVEPDALMVIGLVVGALALIYFLPK